MIVRLPYAVGAARPIAIAAMVADDTTHAMLAPSDTTPWTSNQCPSLRRIRGHNRIAETMSKMLSPIGRYMSPRFVTTAEAGGWRVSFDRWSDHG